MHEEEEEQNVTEFLNADLDLDAAQGLDELVEALAPATAISRFGAIASLELDRQPASPECAIGGFVTLVEKLPPRLRTIWDNARSRLSMLASNPVMSLIPWCMFYRAMFCRSFTPSPPISRLRSISFKKTLIEASGNLPDRFHWRSVNGCPNPGACL